MRDNPTAARGAASTSNLKTPPPVAGYSHAYLGCTFGHLRVFTVAGSRCKRVYFRCKCECGAYRVTSPEKLKEGVVRACRQCARSDAHERARRLMSLTPGQIRAGWRLHLDEFTPKQGAAYYRLIASRGGPDATAEARASAVLEVLTVWLERTREFMTGKEVAR